MKNRRLLLRSVILLILVGALGFTLYTNFFTSKETASEGSEAPDFILTDLSGEKVRLSDFRGKGVFLNFWGTWCPPCKDEMPYMENQYKVFKDQGVEIIAVDVDESYLVVKNFVEQYKLTFPVVIDEGSEVTNTYDIGPLPTTILINKDGVIVKRITGRLDEQEIREHMVSIMP